MKKVIAAAVSAALLLPCLLASASAEIGGNLTTCGCATVSYLGNSSSDFIEVEELLDEYGEEMRESYEDYTAASRKLSKYLLTSFLAKATITVDDRQPILSCISQMEEALLDVIDGSYNVTEDFVGIIAGNLDLTGPITENNIWYDMVRTLEEGRENAVNHAKELCQKLISAVGRALKDEQISEDELREMIEIIDSMDEAMAAQILDWEK